MRGSQQAKAWMFVDSKKNIRKTFQVHHCSVDTL